MKKVSKTEINGMTGIDWVKDDSIAVIRMRNKENYHNPAFANGMLQVLGEIANDVAVTGTVITSSDGKNWSLGIDVEWFSKKMAHELKRESRRTAIPVFFSIGGFSVYSRTSSSL